MAIIPVLTKNGQQQKTATTSASSRVIPVLTRSQPLPKVTKKPVKSTVKLPIKQTPYEETRSVIFDNAKSIFTNIQKATQEALKRGSNARSKLSQKELDKKEGLGAPVGRFLQKTPNLDLGNKGKKTFKATDAETQMVNFLSNFPSGIAQSYGQTLEQLGTKQGKDRLKKDAKRLPETMTKVKSHIDNKEWQEAYEAAMENSAFTVGMDVSDFIPVALLIKLGFKPLKASLKTRTLAKNIVQESIEESVKNVDNVIVPKTEAKTTSPVVKTDTKPVVKEPKKDVANAGLSDAGKYYIRNGLNELVKAENAKPVNLDNGIDAFSHTFGKGTGVVISEAKTGMQIAKGKTEKEAIANAQKAFRDLKGITPQQLIERQLKSLESGIIKKTDGGIGRHIVGDLNTDKEAIPYKEVNRFGSRRIMQGANPSSVKLSGSRMGAKPTSPQIEGMAARESLVGKSQLSRLSQARAEFDQLSGDGALPLGGSNPRVAQQSTPNAGLYDTGKLTQDELYSEFYKKQKVGVELATNPKNRLPSGQLKPEIKAQAEKLAKEQEPILKELESRVAQQSVSDTAKIADDTGVDISLVKEAIASGDLDAAKALYDDLPKGYKTPFETIKKSVKRESDIQDVILKNEEVKVVKEKYGQHQAVVQKMKNFLRLSAEKKNKEGTLFREHIPESVFGVSSDEIATDLGKSEKEFMAQILDELDIQKQDVPKAVKEVGVRRNLLPVGEGKEKYSRLEDRMTKSLHEASDEVKDRLGLAKFNQMNRKDMIQKASKYVTDNPSDALAVLRGEKPTPQGLVTNAIYVAMSNLSKGNVEIARKLASISSTRYGQEINILRELDPYSPATIMNDIVLIREDAFRRKYGNKPPSELRKKVVKDIKDKIKVPNKYDWNNFISSIEC